MDFFKNLFSPEGLMELLYRLPIILMALTVHEYSHGYIAYRMGDSTAKYMGRLTLNPLKHIDPIGLIAMIFVRFGWAKPVPINPRNFKNPKAGMALSALAGPVSNILMAILGAIILGIFNYIGFANSIAFMDVRNFISYTSESDFSSFFIMGIQFFYIFMLVNTYLAVFNFIPVPPLDGSRIVTYFLPPKLGYYYNYIERYGFLVLILLLYTGILSVPLQFLSTFIINGIISVLDFIPFFMY